KLRRRYDGVFARGAFGEEKPRSRDRVMRYFPMKNLAFLLESQQVEAGLRLSVLDGFFTKPARGRAFLDALARSLSRGIDIRARPLRLFTSKRESVLQVERAIYDCAQPRLRDLPKKSALHSHRRSPSARQRASPSSTSARP